MIYTLPVEVTSAMCIISHQVYKDFKKVIQFSVFLISTCTNVLICMMCSYTLSNNKVRINQYCSNREIYIKGPCQCLMKVNSVCLCLCLCVFSFPH